jgi:hypothetical protein
VTPPSVRFLGPKVYLGAIVILISAMRQGPTPRRVRELSTRFGVDRRTIARWQVFWRERFPNTPFWKIAEVLTVPSPGFRGDVMTHTCPESTGALWARFRFSVIGSLLSSPPARGAIQREIRSLAEKTWSHPTTGRDVHFAAVTIARWYCTARRQRDDPVNALRRAVRKDRSAISLAAPLAERLHQFPARGPFPFPSERTGTERSPANQQRRR